MLVKALKILWVLCSLAILGITLRSYTPGPSSDIGVFLIYCMLFLTFPAGLFVSALFALAVSLEQRLGVPLLDVVNSNYVGFCVIWLAFFVTGYLQWFVLLPWLWRKWNARRADNARSS